MYREFWDSIGMLYKKKTVKIIKKTFTKIHFFLNFFHVFRWSGLINNKEDALFQDTCQEEQFFLMRSRLLPHTHTLRQRVVTFKHLNWRPGRLVVSRSERSYRTRTNVPERRRRRR